MGLTEGLIKSGNADGVVKSDELDGCRLDSFLVSLLKVVVASANESKLMMTRCQSRVREVAISSELHIEEV